MPATPPKPDLDGLNPAETLTHLDAYEADGGLLLFVAREPAHEYAAGLLNYLQLRGHLRPPGECRPRGRGFYRIVLDADDIDVVPDLREATQGGSRLSHGLLLGPGARPVTFVCRPAKKGGEGAPDPQEDSYRNYANDSGHIYGSMGESRRWGV